jgi:transposase
LSCIKSICKRVITFSILLCKLFVWQSLSSKPIPSQHQAFLFPPSLDSKIAANHPVRVVNDVIDKLDIDIILRKYKGGGTTSYHPRMLLKVLVYGYLNNIYSSCRIAASVKENIHFRWLAGSCQ